MVRPHRSLISQRAKKPNTAKIIDRLTYSPHKHKQKFTNKLRTHLQARAPTVTATAVIPHQSIKFGSININGLDLEANWAIEQLITKKKFDVGIKISVTKIKSNICRFLQFRKLLAARTNTPTSTLWMASLSGKLREEGQTRVVEVSASSIKMCSHPTTGPQLFPQTSPISRMRDSGFC